MERGGKNPHTHTHKHTHSKLRGQMATFRVSFSGKFRLVASHLPSTHNNQGFIFQTHPNDNWVLWNGVNHKFGLPQQPRNPSPALRTTPEPKFGQRHHSSRAYSGDRSMTLRRKGIIGKQPTSPHLPTKDPIDSDLLGMDHPRALQN